MKTSSVILLWIVLATVGCKVQQLSGNEDKKRNGSKATTKITTLIINGTTEKVLGNYEEAEQIFLECIKEAPETSVAYFELSEIYQLQLNAPKAVENAKKAVALSPNNEYYVAHLAHLYSLTSQFEKAEEAYLKLIELSPENSEYLFQMAEVYLYQKKLNDALLVYNEVEQKTGINEELSMHKYQLFLELNRVEDAMQEIQKLITHNPREVRYYGILGELYETQGETEKAIEQYEQILALDPTNGFVHVSLYEFYKYQGEIEKSQKELRLAFEHRQVDLLAKARILSTLFVDSKENEEIKKLAYELLDIATTIHPKQADGYAIYADFLARDQRDTEALEMLQKAVKYDPSNYAMWNQIMMVELINADYQALHEDSEKAQELFPTQPTFFYFNGIANLQLGKTQMAIEQLEMGKDLIIDNDDLYADFAQYLGDAYHQLKDYIQSDFHYDAALEKRPNNSYVLNNYSYYLSLRKEKLDKAEEMSKLANELNPNDANYLDTYGWVLFVSGKYTEAELYLQKALDNGGGTNGVILEHYGDVLYKLNKTSDAMDYWKKAHEAGGASPLLQEKISAKKYVE